MSTKKLSQGRLLSGERKYIHTQRQEIEKYTYTYRKPLYIYIYIFFRQRACISIYIYRYAYAFCRNVQQQVKSRSGLSARSTFLQRCLLMQSPLQGPCALRSSEAGSSWYFCRRKRGNLDHMSAGTGMEFQHCLRPSSSIQNREHKSRMDPRYGPLWYK